MKEHHHVVRAMRLSACSFGLLAALSIAPRAGEVDTPIHVKIGLNYRHQMILVVATGTFLCTGFMTFEKKLARS